METLNEWLGRQHTVAGAKYPSARQLSLAITDNHNGGMVSEIENRGLVKFETAINLALATETSVLRILMMAELVKKSDIEAISGQVLSEDQERANQIADEMTGGLAKAWLRSGAELLEYEQALERPRRVADASPGYQAGPER